MKHMLNAAVQIFSTFKWKELNSQSLICFVINVLIETLEIVLDSIVVSKCNREIYCEKIWNKINKAIKEKYVSGKELKKKEIKKPQLCQLIHINALWFSKTA